MYAHAHACTHTHTHTCTVAIATKSWLQSAFKTNLLLPRSLAGKQMTRTEQHGQQRSWRGNGNQSAAIVNYVPNTLVLWNCLHYIFNWISNINPPICTLITLLETKKRNPLYYEGFCTRAVQCFPSNSLWYRTQTCTSSNEGSSQARLILCPGSCWWIGKSAWLTLIRSSTQILETLSSTITVPPLLGCLSVHNVPILLLTNERMAVSFPVRHYSGQAAWCT